MTTKLYVGNLSYNVRDHDLEQQFAEFGNVTSAKVMMGNPPLNHCSEK
ncbi:hypothetical protein [Comamonas aquatica]